MPRTGEVAPPGARDGHGTSADPFEDARVAAAYEDWYAAPFGRLAERIETRWLEEFLGELPERARVLEIGCGTGHFAAALASPARTVIGCDTAAAMLARARGRVPVVRADAARLPFADRAFDAAYLVAVLDFVGDPVAVLREARRVAPRVAVIALARGSWLALRRRLSGRRGHPIFSHARFHSRREVLGFARAAGAEPREVRGALVFPPALARLAAPLEERLARGRPPLAGLVGFVLSESD